MSNNAWRDVGVAQTPSPKLCLEGSFRRCERIYLSHVLHDLLQSLHVIRHKYQGMYLLSHLPLFNVHLVTHIAILLPVVHLDVGNLSVREAAVRVEANVPS